MWGERPAAYLGITVPGFPNFFCMYGPGTNLAHGGSLIFHSECQMRYITQCLEALIAGGHRTMEPTPGPLRGLARALPARDSSGWSGRSPRSSTRSSRTPAGRSTC